MVPRGTDFDVVVVGAGHAGCEAALACARLGLGVCLLSPRLDRVAEMSCNPAIGGLGKSQIVREVDALGGEMGRAADAAAIHFRRLNQSKGPAVRARRVQCDMGRYHRVMRTTIESCPGLTLLQGLAVDLLGAGAGRVGGVRLASGEALRARATVLTTGTFLRGRLHTGLVSGPGGRVGDLAADELADAMARLGLPLLRFKTGTPPRLAADSIDFTGLEAQASEPDLLPFSHEGGTWACGAGDRVICHITRTGPATHDLIRAGLDRSPLYTGVIEGRGPRYCPSIEDKVVRFPDRTAHQVVLEPTDLGGRTIYPNGISTSLPLDVQEQMVRSIPGLEGAEIVQAGYAVEYDVVPPTGLEPSLQVRGLSGLYLAGQINGTSGYEEAAGQGLMAGINAARALGGQAPIVLRRDQAYIGVMIDDLIRRGAQEPYRMFSSRAEYRLLLREDNALSRLAEAAGAAGLVPEDVRAARRVRVERAEALRQRLETIRTAPEAGGRRPTLAQILKRPAVRLDQLLAERGETEHPDVVEQVEVAIKYQGYVDRQVREAKRLAAAASRPIPADMDFSSIPGLSAELAEKLDRFKPATFGDAERIDGMTPAALGVLSILLDRADVPRGTSRRTEARNHD